jgi:RHS repeat-associated protein
MTSKAENGSTLTYNWNAENHLTRVLLNGNEVARFAYDALGRRVEKVTSGVIHSYVHEGDHVVEERSTGGAIGTIRYFHGPGTDDWLGRQNADASTTYFVADNAVGSIVAETNSAGQVTLARTLDAWGNLDTTSAPTGGPAFTGRWWEPDVELYDYRARWLDAEVGRFLSEDPIRFSGGANFYSYVNNNPINRLDSSGLKPCNPRMAAYIQSMCKVAKSASAAGCPCPCSILLVQSGYESGWGRFNDDPNKQRENNYFGLHGVGDAGSRPAAGDPKVTIPKYSGPESSFSDYCSRVKNKGITYKNDSQYVHDVTTGMVFAVGHQPQYIRNIMSTLQDCSKELATCCGGK